MVYNGSRIVRSSLELNSSTLSHRGRDRHSKPLTKTMGDKQVKVIHKDNQLTKLTRYFPSGAGSTGGGLSGVNGTS